MENISFIRKKLTDWYAINQRDLPWRNIHDPYRIWISEIILQRTRVVYGLNYYNRFVCRFPDVQTLAKASEQEVLKYWQGLGYYSRARNLHAAARTIVNEYAGEFPQTYFEILSLKGIGEYTASAILSFVWNRPYPTVDGNVFRFLSRLFAVNEPVDTARGKRLFSELAGKIMDKFQPGTFNQAIMEFGALQCIPVSPDCSVCPFLMECLAYAENSVVQYPMKFKKTKTKDLYLYYFHIHDAECFYIIRRDGKRIWQNLFEFPLIESETPLDFEQLSQTKHFQKWFSCTADYDFRLTVSKRRHVLSHRILYATFYDVATKRLQGAPKSFLKINWTTIDNYPIHSLMQYYLKKIDDCSF